MTNSKREEGIPSSLFFCMIGNTAYPELPRLQSWLLLQQSESGGRYQCQSNNTHHRGNSRVVYPKKMPVKQGSSPDQRQYKSCNEHHLCFHIFTSINILHPRKGYIIKDYLTRQKIRSASKPFIATSVLCQVRARPVPSKYLIRESGYFLGNLTEMEPLDSKGYR